MPENPPTINELRRFEDAIRRRNPRLAEALQPGLARHMISSVLQSAAVTGDPSPVLDIFSWRNGTKMTPAMTLQDMSVFPKSTYCFPDLQALTEHFIHIRDSSILHPTRGCVLLHFFPLFWDGATGYLAIDLEDASQHPMVLIDPEMESFYRSAYRSFRDFLVDAIRANVRNHPLVCFQ